MKIFPLKRKKKISSGMLSEIIKKADKFSGLKNKKALFDLDNTLLSGDIGDALFARLKNLEKSEKVKVDGTEMNFTWDRYEEMVNSGEKEYAYRMVTKCMESVPVKVITDLTRELMNSDFKYIDHVGNKVRIPFVKQEMKEFVNLLKSSGFEIIVISASNIFSVRVITEEYFGLGPETSFGIEPKLTKTVTGEIVLTDKLVEPVPVNEGKTKLYSKKFGTNLPVITVGDSLLDFPMLNLVDDNGIVVWMGDSGSEYEKLKDFIGERADVIIPGFAKDSEKDSK